MPAPFMLDIDDETKALAQTIDLETTALVKGINLGTTELINDIDLEIKDMRELQNLELALSNNQATAHFLKALKEENYTEATKIVYKNFHTTNLSDYPNLAARIINKSMADLYRRIHNPSKQDHQGLVHETDLLVTLIEISSVLLTQQLVRLQAEYNKMSRSNAVLFNNHNNKLAIQYLLNLLISKLPLTEAYYNQKGISAEVAVIFCEARSFFTTYLPYLKEKQLAENNTLVHNV